MSGLAGANDGVMARRRIDALGDLLEPLLASSSAHSRRPDAEAGERSIIEREQGLAPEARIATVKTQWRNLPVPYAVSAASRSGLSPNRSSVRLIIVFVAATSS